MKFVYRFSVPKDNLSDDVTVVAFATVNGCLSETEAQDGQFEFEFAINEHVDVAVSYVDVEGKVFKQETVMSCAINPSNLKVADGYSLSINDEEHKVESSVKETTTSLLPPVVTGQVNPEKAK